MISHSKRFVFIHIFKVAGTSVRSVLTPHCDNLNRPKRIINRISHRAINKQIFQPYSPPLDGHAKATEYRDFLGEVIFSSYFKFSFVRNPYDWQVSMYEYVRQTPHHNQHKLINGMSFDEYIHWRCAEDPILQVDFLRDEEKNIIVDFVGKFESIDDDFTKVMTKMGVDGKLPWMNKSIRKSWSEYYTAETKALVDTTFREDFDILGYAKSL